MQDLCQPAIKTGIYDFIPGFSSLNRRTNLAAAIGRAGQPGFYSRQSHEQVTERSFGYIYYAARLPEASICELVLLVPKRSGLYSARLDKRKSRKIDLGLSPKVYLLRICLSKFTLLSTTATWIRICSHARQCSHLKARFHLVLSEFLYFLRRTSPLYKQADHIY